MLQTVTTWYVKWSKAEKLQWLFAFSCTNWIWLMQFFTTVCLITQSLSLNLHVKSFTAAKLNGKACFCWYCCSRYLFTVNAQRKDTLLCLLSKYKADKKDKTRLINNPNTRPVMVFSVSQFSNINALLTTQTGCYLLYCPRCTTWHIVITKDLAYVCRTNDTPVVPLLSYSVSSYLLYTVLGRAGYLCLMCKTEEKIHFFNSWRLHSWAWWDIIPATSSVTQMGMRLCFYLAWN